MNGIHQRRLLRRVSATPMDVAVGQHKCDIRDALDRPPIDTRYAFASNRTDSGPRDLSHRACAWSCARANPDEARVP